MDSAPSPPSSNGSHSSSPPRWAPSASSSKSLLLGYRAGTLSTLEERQALRRVRQTSLRWVDGGAVYVDRTTGMYWETTGALLCFLRARRHSQASSAARERLAEFGLHSSATAPAQGGDGVVAVKVESELGMLRDQHAAARRYDTLCGPLEDNEILAGLDSWFQDHTPAMTPSPDALSPADR